MGEWEDRVLEEARRLQPDLVVWTGDYVQPRLSPTRADAESRLRAVLRHRPVPAVLGSYAVRGDVDVNWPRVLASTGVATLSEDVVRVPLPGGRTLRLVGLASGTSRGRDRVALARELGDVPAGDLSIVAGHNPSYVRLLPGLGRVDLALAGHTHGGQVALPLIGAPYTKSLLPRRYARGLHDFEGIPVHVSAGIGMERGVAPQVRFLFPARDLPARDHLLDGRRAGRPADRAQEFPGDRRRGTVLAVHRVVQRRMAFSSMRPATATTPASPGCGAARCRITGTAS